MLNPNDRSLYTAALTPPPGMVFDEAIATTYSLDPAVLLSIPVHLAFLGVGSDRLRDSIAALEAIRRLSNRMTVYADRGRMQVPAPPHPLYGLLESVIVEVQAPRKGAFHAKVWVLRFVDPGGEGSPLLRLMILSRNLTADRSWDLALTLEGTPTQRYRAESRELGELIAALPRYATRQPDEFRIEQAERLGREVRCTPWQMPIGFTSVRFHVNGTHRRYWEPLPSKKMAVISPFCSEEALDWLARSTREPAVLVSRSEQLESLPLDRMTAFPQRLCLDEAAETDDGDSPDQASVRDSLGLHAKAYILERGWDTHLIMGSANATNPALLKPTNVEVLAELVGKRSKVGDIDRLMGPDGLGPVLVSYGSSQVAEPERPEEVAAERVRESARSSLVTAALRIRCAPAGAEGTWIPVLTGTVQIPKGISSVRTWLVTMKPENAVDLAPLLTGGAVRLAPCACESLTGLIAFELIAEGSIQSLSFVLNLPVDGLPAEREGAIFRLVVENQEGFLRYLLLLLGDIEGSLEFTRGDGGSFGSWGKGLGTQGLLEEMVRAYCREPKRLVEVQKIVSRLMESDDARQVVPDEFLKVWRTFVAAMEADDGE